MFGYCILSPIRRQYCSLFSVVKPVTQELVALGVHLQKAKAVARRIGAILLVLTAIRATTPTTPLVTRWTLVQPIRTTVCPRPHVLTNQSGWVSARWELLNATVPRERPETEGHPELAAPEMPASVVCLI